MPIGVLAEVVGLSVALLALPAPCVLLGTLARPALARRPAPQPAPAPAS